MLYIVLTHDCIIIISPCWMVFVVKARMLIFHVYTVLTYVGLGKRMSNWGGKVEQKETLGNPSIHFHLTIG